MKYSRRGFYVYIKILAPRCAYFSTCALGRQELITGDNLLVENIVITRRAKIEK